MFRELRRKKNAIDIPTVKALLQSSRRGVLAVNGDDGYPYAVPINYFYDEPTQKIYFHGARAGHKVLCSWVIKIALIFCGFSPIFFMLVSAVLPFMPQSIKIFVFPSDTKVQLPLLPLAKV